MSRDDRRSPEAAAYRWMYGTAAWRDLRDAQLAKEPLCGRCARLGRVVAAYTANHVVPHKGDRRLFYSASNLESVCKPCHDGPIQRSERLGFSPAVDAGGWPTDPRHHANKRRRP